MTKTYLAIFIALLAIAGAIYYFSAPNNTDTAAASEMSFFVASANPGQGANLGGLAGADNYCQNLADAAGAGDRAWRAYLSAAAREGFAAVNARDRIGNGPWKNFYGIVIAENLEQLHGFNNINKQTALTEKGAAVNGRGDTPNLHDILTGSDENGRAIATSTDTTCNNWLSGNEGAAMVGHHDRLGLREDTPSRSWNSSHLSRGCSPEALAGSGGGGLFYCFALTQ